MHRWCNYMIMKSLKSKTDIPVPMIVSLWFQFSCNECCLVWTGLLKQDPIIVCISINATESGSVHEAPLKAMENCANGISSSIIWTLHPVQIAGSFSISWVLVRVSIQMFVNNFLDNSIISSCLRAPTTDTTCIICHK